LPQPSPLPKALKQVEAWLASPSLVLLAEASSHFRRLRDILAISGVVGARVHGARISALCLDHGVSELWSADRDFARFPGLNVINPLLAA
jgi:predicted nucleic acid-binding protein